MYQKLCIDIQTHVQESLCQSHPRPLTLKNKHSGDIASEVKQNK